MAGSQKAPNLSRNLQPTPPGGIPGQEGLRTPLVGPMVRLAPGARGGGVKDMGPMAKRLFRGCDVAEPAVLSIDCYFEHPADSTAVSLGDAVFPTSQGALVYMCVRVCVRACANFAISHETQTQKHRSIRERWHQQSYWNSTLVGCGFL